MAKRPMYLQHVNIYVRDAERSKQWYEDLLGLHTYEYRPGWAAFMSADEQQSHEVKLIKKIQVLNRDLQVLVRETGKTPDLVVGGVVTELKSLIGDKIDLTYLINKANSQVHEHAERHRLGNGAVVKTETSVITELERSR